MQPGCETVHSLRFAQGRNCLEAPFSENTLLGLHGQCQAGLGQRVMSEPWLCPYQPSGFGPVSVDSLSLYFLNGKPGILATREAFLRAE